MKRLTQALALCLGITILIPTAQATGAAVPIYVDDQVTTIRAHLWDNTTYVSLRELTCYLEPTALVLWENKEAIVLTDELYLVARAGDSYFTNHDTQIPVPYSILLSQGYTMVPIRPLAEMFDTTVDWCGTSKSVFLYSKEYSPEQSLLYTEEDLYWLSRIISAESGGESLEGQLAVGHVVLNRVSSDLFPDTIYDVIFDDRWGGQFEPVRNGTIYNDPTDMSVQSALLCYEVESPVDDSLYFLAPDLTDNHWVMENCEYIATIGCHWFYR